MCFVVQSSTAGVPGPVAGRAVFKGEMRPVGIGLDRRRMSEQAAEIDEVFLASGALIKFGVSPFIDEGLRRESHQRKSP